MAEKIFKEKFGNIKKIKICTTTADIDFDTYTEPGAYEIYEDMGNGRNRIYSMTVDKSAAGACIKQTRIYCGTVEARQSTSVGTWKEWKAVTGEGGGSYVLTEEDKQEIVDDVLDETVLTPTDSKYFDIDYDGIISLKPEYRGHSNKADFPYSISDKGLEVDGSKNNELPKRLVIPEVINDTVVTGFVAGMFIYNYAVEEIVFPDTVAELPDSFCRCAAYLKSIKNTEHITKLGDRVLMNTRIGEAKFPNLKETGGRAFLQCPLLYAVDIGDKITTIPDYFVKKCEKLSFVKGGASVTTIGTEAFAFTYNLTNVPFLETAKISKIGNSAFTSSRIQFDWSKITNCTFGTNATPIMDNTTDFWSNCTYKSCENPLVTMLHQRNPLWKNETYGTTDLIYGDWGCTIMTAMHIHSAITGEIYNSPKEFEERVLKSKTYPTGEPLLSKSPSTRENQAPFFIGLGYEITFYEDILTQAAFQDVLTSLANGDYVFSHVGTSSNVNGGHAVVLYGVNEFGEVLVCDSDTAVSSADIYDKGLTYRVPFQNITGPDSNIIIVRKP